MKKGCGYGPLVACPSSIPGTPTTPSKNKNNKKNFNLYYVRRRWGLASQVRKNL